MRGKPKQTLSDIEFKETRHSVEWFSRRPTSKFILPSREVMNTDLEINQLKHSFSKRLGYHMKLDPVSEHHAIMDLVEILSERNIQSKVEKVRTQKIAQQKLQGRNVQLWQASTLIKQGYADWAIKSKLGISQKVIREAKRKRWANQSEFVCRQGRKFTWHEADFSALQQASLRNELQDLSAGQIQKIILGKRSKEEGQLSDSRVKHILKKKIGLSYKNYALFKDQTNRPSILTDRVDFAQHICPVIRKGVKLVFIDETSCWDCVKPRRSWLPRGRAVTPKFQGTGQKFTVIGAVSEERFEGYMVVEKGMHAEQFMAFISGLLKQLEAEGELKNCLLVCDNASAHNACPVWKNIFAHIPVIFLPSYSPQLNPIELVWALMKRNLSKERFSDEVSMLRAINKSLYSIPPEHYTQLFNHTLRYLKLGLLGKKFGEDNLYD